ncbi:MAG: hypothetical protein D6762_00330, partial [Candidatus Neomarinimicrobiota bacterium]
VPTFLPDPTALRVSGFAAGLGGGLLVEQAYVGFHSRTGWWKQGAKVLLGIGVGFALQQGLKLVFPAGAGWIWLRYGVFGLWIGYGAPVCFRFLNWEDRLRNRPPAPPTPPAS